MGVIIGFLLILCTAAGGIYLYLKVARLDREIASQKETARREIEFDDG